MPRPKGSGRQKGSKNKFNWDVESLAMQLNVNPLEILLKIADGDWQGLGYEEKQTYLYTNDGRMVAKDVISLDQRLKASEAAAKYLFTQKRAVELSSPEDKGFEVIIKDYGKA